MDVGIDFNQYKRKMANAAKELGYNENVIRSIKNAKTDSEISSIMRNARVKREYEELDTRWLDKIIIKKGGK